jgi:hypothetical protein
MDDDAHRTHMYSLYLPLLFSPLNVDRPRLFLLLCVRIEIVQLQRGIRAIEEWQERDMQRLREKHDTFTEMHSKHARHIRAHWLKVRFTNIHMR